MVIVLFFAQQYEGYEFLWDVTLRHVNLTTLKDETSTPCETSGTIGAVTQPYIPEELTPLSLLVIRIGVQWTWPPRDLLTH
jgi:hypothetical protein